MIHIDLIMALVGIRANLFNGRGYYWDSSMTLGDLEFKAEDFDLGFKAGPKMLSTDDAAEVANRLLRERLGKTEQVFMAMGFGHYDRWTKNINDLDSYASHTARLVCVEEIK